MSQSHWSLWSVFPLTPTSFQCWANRDFWARVRALLKSWLAELEPEPEPKPEPEPEPEPRAENLVKPNNASPSFPSPYNGVICKPTFNHLMSKSSQSDNTSSTHLVWLFPCDLYKISRHKWINLFIASSYQPKVFQVLVPESRVAPISQFPSFTGSSAKRQVQGKRW